jgi:3-oxoacyl-[acyl-carrier protein] reductase
MGKLDGKVAIVTGAARGMGHAYAHRLASLGASIAVFDRDLKSYREIEAEAMKAETTVDEINDAGGRAAGYEVDVTDEAAVKEMVDDVAAKWGHVDIAVCNAGGMFGDSEGQEYAATTTALTKAAIQFTVDLNLIGTANVVHAAAEYMKAQRWGRIVTISSIAASITNKQGAGGHYGAAKAAVQVYTRYIAQELGPFGINANCIVPGSIATGFKVSNPSIANDVLIPRIALGRSGTVEDAAGVVEFLCTDLSDYVTGAVIPLDGGQRSTDID